MSSESLEVCVAFQGEHGAYSEAAIFEYFKRCPDILIDGSLKPAHVRTLPCETFEDAFLAVQQGKAHKALIPIQNSLGGSIHVNYDLLLRYDLHIIGELDFRVRHCLMALPGVKIEDLESVKSHPQALAQCEFYLKSINAKAIHAYDTAGAAKMVRDEGNMKTGALASELAAELYGLNKLAIGVEDESNNYTRFLLLDPKPLQVPRSLIQSPQFSSADFGNLKVIPEQTLGDSADASAAAAPSVPPEPISFKTSIVFSLNESPGVLFKALSVFALRDVDLTKIESRPGKNMSERINRVRRKGKEPSERFNYYFYVDFMAHVEAEKSSNALRHLQEIAPFMRVLGSYPVSSDDSRKYSLSLSTTVRV